MRWVGSRRLPAARVALALLGVAAWAALGALTAGCDGGEDGARDAAARPTAPPTARPTARLDSAHAGRSPNAKPGYRRLQDEDRSVARHPADGSGRAWLSEPAPGSRLEAGTAHRFAIEVEVGEHGIAPGGSVVLQISPHWGWSRPQLEDSGAPGYTEVATDAAGVSLAPRFAGRRRVVVEVQGRALAPGERVRIVYGAGPAGANVDQFAENASPIWIGVDGDGDGWWSLLPDPPRVDIAPAPPAGLVLLLPGTARPGDVVELTVAALDPRLGAGFPFEGRVELASDPPGLPVPAAIELRPEDAGHRTLSLAIEEEGTWRVRGAAVLSGQRRTAESNPLVVAPDVPRLRWGDLHGHSQLSDGTGTPSDYFRYARDVAALDVAALTDHDRWGVRFLDSDPDAWEAVRAAVREANEPGRFVALLGYEWTSWLRGHRHVLYFDDDGVVYSATDPETDEARELWDALAGQRALTFAHHTAGEPVAVDWGTLPDPVLEPVVEIASLHGSSEAADTPRPVEGGIEGHYVRDVLERGARLGFIGSGDSHNGTPGLAHLTGRRGGGLAAILSEDLTREGILEALRERRVYATNGPRIVLQATLDGRPIGSVVPAAPGAVHELVIRVASEQPLDRVDRIRSDGRIESLDGQGRRAGSWALSVPGLEAGEYLYLRVVQQDGGTAWSSPFHAE